MKKIGLSVFILALVFLISSESSAKENITVGGGIYFHSELQSYGNWYKLRGGINVWRPSGVSFSWQPYKYGRWFWTDDGWYWDSNEDFGYITFHYGRWYYDDYYGWVWVPGNRWAPAWVDWRYDNDYIGWAPLPPYAEFSIGIGISFTNNFHYGYNYWNFVTYNNFCSANVYNYFAINKYKYRIYSNTKYRNNYGYNRGRVINRGVDLKYVRKRSRNNIVTRDIKRVDNIRDLKKRDKNYVRSYEPSSKRNVVDRDKRNTNTRDNIRNRTNLNDRNKISRDKRPDINTRSKVYRDRRPEVNTRSKIYREKRPDVNTRTKIYRDKNPDLNTRNKNYRNTQPRIEYKKRVPEKINRQPQIKNRTRAVPKRPNRSTPKKERVKRNR